MCRFVGRCRGALIAAHSPRVVVVYTAVSNFVLHALLKANNLAAVVRSTPTALIAGISGEALGVLRATACLHAQRAGIRLVVGVRNAGVGRPGRSASITRVTLICGRRIAARRQSAARPGGAARAS